MHCATSRNVAGLIPGGVIDIILPARLSQWSTHPLTRNEYQEDFRKSKGGRYVRLTTLPPSCTVVMKSRNVILQKSSWHVHAYRGFALPLPFWYIHRVADKSLARPGRQQANVSVRMSWISFGSLPCRGKKKLDDSSRLDVVEIARVPVMLPSLFPSWSG